VVSAGRLDGWIARGELQIPEAPMVRIFPRGGLTRSAGVSLGLLTTGVAIGAVSTLVAAMWTITFHPLPVSGMDRIAVLSGLSDPIVQDAVEWWSGLKSASALARYRVGRVAEDEETGAQRPVVAAVSPGFFRVFALRPAAGRFFSRQDETDRSRIAVVSREYWSARFGSGPVFGTASIRLRGLAYTIAGVAPPRFNFPAGAQVWVPETSAEELGLNGAQRERLSIQEPLGWVARLAPGSSMGGLQAEAATRLHYLNTVISPRTGIHYGEVVSVWPITAYISGEFRPALLALLLGAAMVLGIAAANTAALFLRRAVDGRKEAAVRLVFGASPGRLARDVALESIGSTLVSGCAGLGVALLLGAVIRRSIFGGVLLENWDAGAMGVALAVSVLVSALAGLAVSLPAALRYGRQDPAGVLQGRDLMGRRGRILRRALVVGEIGLAACLLTLADSAVRGAIREGQADRGFTAEHVLTAELNVPMGGKSILAAPILSELRAAPGTSTAALWNGLPIPGSWPGKLYLWAGNVSTSAFAFAVTEDCFRALGIPILAGRNFQNGDGDVVIVSRRLADSIAPGRSAVGFNIRLDGETSPRRVIGVVGELPNGEHEAHPVPEMYLPWSHPFLGRAAGHAWLVIKCRDDCGGTLTALRAETGKLGGYASIFDIVPFSERISRLSENQNNRLGLFSAFAFCATLIAWLGVFAMASYETSCRKFDAGVRAAMGARPADLALMLVGEPMACAAGGLITGAALALALSTVLKTAWFGAGALEPMSYGRAAAFLLLGVVAGVVPAARRISGMNAGEALRDWQA
jgi:putative ABC transport system permease protein